MLNKKRTKDKQVWVVFCVHTTKVRRLSQVVIRVQLMDTFLPQCNAQRE